MSDHEHLGNGVHHLDAHYIQAGVASFYCVVEDDEIAIVDTGTSNSLPYLKQFLDDYDLHAEQVKYIMPTHVHLDHAGGAGVMMQHCPNAQLVVHPRGARHMIDPSKLIEGTIAVYGEDKFHRLYGEIPPIDESRVIRAQDDDVYELKNRALRIIDAPGHAYHHYCVYDEASAGIFSGDNFGVSYPNLVHEGKRVVIPTTTPIHFNPEALQGTVTHLMDFNPERIYLAHFNELPNPAELVNQYKLWIDLFVHMTEMARPDDDAGVGRLIDAIGEALQEEFDISPLLINTQLRNDIQLDAEGLAVWYRNREQ
jgi:glyoxylase-like metal-dependent hydrolase (beta-lactamase superfamily II)